MFHLDRRFCEAEQIPQRQARRADFVITSLPALHLIAYGDAFFGSQTDHLSYRISGLQPHRIRLIHSQPGNGQQAGVLDFQFYGHGRAQEGVVVKPAVHPHVLEAPRRPPTRHHIDTGQHVDQIEDEIQPQQDSDEQQDQ